MKYLKLNNLIKNISLVLILDFSILVFLSLISKISFNDKAVLALPPKYDAPKTRTTYITPERIL